MKNKLWVKIVVWILAILMIGSCVSAALISIFAAKVSAAEIPRQNTSAKSMAQRSFFIVFYRHFP